ncbi:DEAD/DEAH box helicase family protein [Aequorivita sp. KMM 9714]|uniref:DEAD/DEAH box helicase family protein n=1 Tax=Aequorivita sp. KMM 9714 TaxID=2707173 RepID=UPI0013EA939F|nr:DEAD/DEAH box helicase family protein [Aequorivita sp. KMM 9714]NGX84718.1 DEAD/DEAH box helicase family protein [Aequorivita sp. KMM 9714]
MYILRDFQETAVKSLLEHTYTALQQPTKQTPILLESPTGSGKTVMMASYLERLTEELRVKPGFNNDVAFIWLAPNTLHIQSYHALQSLYEDTKKLNCIDLDSLGTNPTLDPNDLLFLNWSSVHSAKNIWRKDNESNTNLETLIENTQANDTTIILVIDEAHLSAFGGKQAIAVRNLIEADVEILVTATAHNIQRPQLSVFVPRHKVVEQELIKKGIRLNIDLDPEEQNGENVHMHLLRKAFQKKEELKALYNKELGENCVNPLLLIQLPSDNVSLSSEDKSIRDTLVGLLNVEYNVSTQNGRLAIWLSGEKDKDNIEDINGFQDVLIFKQAVAQGWDCPRAAVLVSYRTVNSPSFGIQTVGRILRMPHRRHYELDDLNYGYVFTNIESTKINFEPSDVDFINFQLAKRQNDRGWVFNNINSAQIINDRAAKGVLTSTFQTHFFGVMEHRYGLTMLPDVDLFTPEEGEKIKKVKEANLLAMKQNGWEFEVDHHQIPIPVNVEADPYIVNSIVLNANQTKQFAITMNQFNIMFEHFCYDNITRLNRSKSWKKLRDVLLFFAEYYLGIFEHDAKKIYLFPQNRRILEELIVTALEKFEQWQKAKGNENRRVEYSSWQVPEYRYYSENFNKEHIESHAMVPFYEYTNVSSPEKRFKEFLESNSDHIEWWYKNGDSGKEHFAVPYVKQADEKLERHSLFYVDFVIKFKSGKIGLFDTKTKRSDLDAPKKHNALLDYMDEVNSTNEEELLIGGVLIEDSNGSNHWRYCINRIEDTNDLTGWEFLKPETC